MKKLIFLASLSVCLSAFAQMPDMLGTLAIQGVMTERATQSAVQGLSSSQKLRVFQDIQRIAMEIKTGYLGNYASVSRNSVSGSPLSGIDWSVGPYQSYYFYIQLNQIDNKNCSYLLSRDIGAYSVSVNGQNNNTMCGSSNTIKWIFE